MNDFEENFSIIDTKRATYRRSVCLHTINKLAECDACYEICPVDAITGGKPPKFSEEDCVGCRACLTVCPTGAYEGKTDVLNVIGAVDKAITKHHIQRADLICDKHPHPQTGPADSQLGLRVEGCLAQLGSATYLSLAELGLEKVYARVDACQECPWGKLQPTISQQVENAALLLNGVEETTEFQAVEDTEEFVERPGWNAASPPLSRAELLKPKTFFTQTENVKKLSPDEVKVGTSRLSKERRRRIAALDGLSVKAEVPADEITTDPHYLNLTVTDDCSACQTCGKSCPTGAIRFLHSDADMIFNLKFSPLACVNCQICIKLCPDQAIVESPPTLDQVVAEEHTVLLKVGPLKRCKRCNALMTDPEGGDICTACYMRLQNPFSSQLPPGFTRSKK